MKHYAIALVHAWIVSNPDYYCSWVNAYKTRTWDSDTKTFRVGQVGGHWRRRENWARILPTLRCVCVFETLVDETPFNNLLTV